MAIKLKITEDGDVILVEKGKWKVEYTYSWEELRITHPTEHYIAGTIHLDEELNTSYIDTHVENFSELNIVILLLKKAYKIVIKHNLTPKVVRDVVIKARYKREGYERKYVKPRSR